MSRSTEIFLRSEAKKKKTTEQESWDGPFLSFFSVHAGGGGEWEAAGPNVTRSVLLAVVELAVERSRS